jgi:RND family efflux transporter MFP subunit
MGAKRRSPACRAAPLRLLLPLLAVALTAAAPAHKGGAPSALVRTETPRAGALPRTVIAYGTARPAPYGTITLGVQHAGMVRRVFVVPGQLVAKDAALFSIAAAPAVIAQYHQALTAVAVARSERAHMAQLRAQQLATRDQLARADKAVADAAAALQALVREGGADPRQTVRAPFAGVVTTIAAAPGQAVAADAPLLALARRRSLVVAVGIDPAAAGSVRAGQAVTLTPLDGGTPIAGRVDSVGGMLDPITHLVDATISLGTGDPLGGAGFRAAIEVAQDPGWIVPRDAVLTGADGPAVFQVAKGHAVRVAVRVVGEAGGQTVVAGPIDPHRPLVVSGNYQLAPGMAVRVAPAPHPAAASPAEVGAHPVSGAG